MSGRNRDRAHWLLGPRLLSDPGFRTVDNIALFGAAVFMVIWILWVLTHAVVSIRNGVRSERFVALAPKGIYHSEAGWTAFFPWDDLFKVWAISNYGSKTQPTQRIRLHAWDDDKMFVEDRRRIKWPKIDRNAPGNGEIVAGELAIIDVAVPYWALKFYHENSEYRTELGTEAGLRRFQQGDFPCEQD